MSFKEFCGTVPTCRGNVRVSVDKKGVTVISQVDNGYLVIGNKRHAIKKNEELRVNF